MRAPSLPPGFQLTRRRAQLARRPEWDVRCLTCGVWTWRATRASAALWAREHACVDHLRWSDDDPLPPPKF